MTYQHTISMLHELLTSLKHAKIARVGEALDKMSEHDENELREAVRLVRGFIRNV